MQRSVVSFKSDGIREQAIKMEKQIKIPGSASPSLNYVMERDLLSFEGGFCSLQLLGDLSIHVHEIFGF